MASSDLHIQEQLQLLRDSYAENLPDKLGEISSAWEKLDTAGWDSDRSELLHRLTHSMAGSAPTFGFPELGRRARKIEQVLKHWRESKLVPNDAERAEVTLLLDELRQAAAVTASTQSYAVASETVADKPAARTEKAPVYLIEDDALLASELALQLDHFGYDTQVFSSTSSVTEAVARQYPAALIVDIMLPEGPDAGLDVLRRLQQRDGANLPMIFVSVRDDFETRLAAARAGGDAYFVKPVEISPLVDRLDQLTRRNEQAPYRILVVDDDETLANHYSLVLRGAGMEVHTLTRPETVIKVLSDVKPELILMDVYMPTCSGLELAKLIRQQETYLSIPIVFLSSETNLEKQFLAMRMGGDDFLTKPIEDSHLVSSVTVRAERARLLSALMVQDSLTGLLKHTMIKEQLSAELSRARRTKSNMTFAMLDIDHFKQINDRYGHMTGDRVIKSLARLLQQRLRKSDSIGRYGGEEFAVVLPHCDVDVATRIMNEIRNDFSAIRFLYDDQEFSVSFSAGLAGFPSYESTEDINQAADEALYEAKRKGRNCVVTAASRK
jgi:diguanylate cyclase (GGDEF)-like protein